MSVPLLTCCSMKAKDLKFRPKGIILSGGKSSSGIVAGRPHLHKTTRVISNRLDLS